MQIFCCSHLAAQPFSYVQVVFQGNETAVTVNSDITNDQQENMQICINEDMIVLCSQC